MIAVGLPLLPCWGIAAGIDVGFMWDSCGIDVEFPMALLGDCCERARGLLRYSYCGIAVGLLWYCCDLAVGFPWLLLDCHGGC